MFQFSFNSTTLRNMDALEALRQVRAHGYAGVELTLNDSHLHPLKTPPGRVAEIARYCGEIGLPVVCLATGGDRLLSDVPYEPSLVSADAGGRGKRLDLLKRSLEIAKELRAPVMNFNSGFLREGVEAGQADEWLHAAVDELLRSAGDLILAIEPEPGFFIGTSRAGCALVRKVGSPRFRLNLDIGHVHCSEDDCYDAIDMALPLSRHVHIEDIRNRVHHHEIPGEGDIDFARVLQSLDRSSYSHFVSVELHHHADVWERALAESLAYLTRLAGRP